MDEKTGKWIMPCEVYSRVVGYYRPVACWNLGKKKEFEERKTFDSAIDGMIEEPRRTYGETGIGNDRRAAGGDRRVGSRQDCSG